MFFLDNFNKEIINSVNKDHLYETLEKYKELIIKLKQFNEKEMNAYLSVIKKNELINNQEMENQSIFITELDQEINLYSSLDIMQYYINGNIPLTRSIIQKLHKIVIRGSEDDMEKNYPFRNYDVYVSEFNNGVEEVCYFPPTPDLITKYMKSIIKYINNKNCTEEDIFLKPFIIHAFISILQPFGNGNTRLARLIQHGEIFKYTKSLLDNSFNMPLLYLSKNYLYTKNSYRKNIQNLANGQDVSYLDDWIDYNLRMVDEQLFFSNNSLDDYSKKVLRKYSNL